MSPHKRVSYIWHIHLTIDITDASRNIFVITNLPWNSWQLYDTKNCMDMGSRSSSQQNSDRSTSLPQPSQLAARKNKYDHHYGIPIFWYERWSFHRAARAYSVIDPWRISCKPRIRITRLAMSVAWEDEQSRSRAACRRQCVQERCPETWYRRISSLFAHEE